ncbi:MAG: type II secretion system protein [Fimbriimonadaceae bacterium]
MDGIGVSTTRQNRGLSLVEILVVTAILAVVAGILIPVLLSSKRQAGLAVDISNLRQIGQAAEIYRQDTDGAWPLTVFPLLDGGILKGDQILRSPLDATPSGMSYLFSLEWETPAYQRTDVFVSYVGVLQVGLDRDYFESDIRPATNPGWLVNLTSTERYRPNSKIRIGRYHRLFLDGSVAVRHIGLVSAFNPNVGSAERMYHTALLFVDEEPEWLKEHF